MNTQQAIGLGKNLFDHVVKKEYQSVKDLLDPVLNQRTPFRLLTLIGKETGRASMPTIIPLLDLIAADHTRGGWVIIAGALHMRLRHNPETAIKLSEEYIIQADTWYATAIFAERVPGPALFLEQKRAMPLLAHWRFHPNRWIRRTTGTAIHYCAKQLRGKPESEPRVHQLLLFIEPMIEDTDSDAVKGIGWGLKTLGQYYPKLMASWLQQQLNEKQKVPRKLLIDKATAFLSPEQCTFVDGKER